MQSYPCSVCKIASKCNHQLSFTVDALSEISYWCLDRLQQLFKVNVLKLRLFILTQVFWFIMSVYSGVFSTKATEEEYEIALSRHEFAAIRPSFYRIWFFESIPHFAANIN